jgi:hypothetical protein
MKYCQQIKHPCYLVKPRKECCRKCTKELKEAKQ